MSFLLHFFFGVDFRPGSYDDFMTAKTSLENVHMSGGKFPISSVLIEALPDQVMLLQMLTISHHFIYACVFIASLSIAIDWYVYEPGEQLELTILTHTSLKKLTSVLLVSFHNTCLFRQ